MLTYYKRNSSNTYQPTAPPTPHPSHGGEGGLVGTWFVLMRSYYLLLERVRASMEHSSDSSLQTRYTIIVPPYLSLSSYLELGAKAHEN